MGQKVHPIGFRVGITKKHQSQWFARFTKYSYAQSILEDRMLRNTLISIANEALNSNLIKKRDSAFSENSIIPKITHIKIERGLIPYEIGIQIHAENCQKLKSSLNNIKINKELLCKLQKTRRFLMSLGKNQSSVQSSIATSDSFFSRSEKKNSKQAFEISGENDNGGLKSNDLKEESRDTTVKSAVPFIKASQKSTQSTMKNSVKKKLFCFSSVKPNLINTTILNSPNFAPFKKASFAAKRGVNQFKKRKRPNFLSMVYKKKKIIIRRLRKRQEIRQRYRRLMLKGLLVQKKGKMIRCVSSLFFSKKQIKKTSKQNSQIQNQQKLGISKGTNGLKDKNSLKKKGATFLTKDASLKGSNIEKNASIKRGGVNINKRKGGPYKTNKTMAYTKLDNAQMDTKLLSKGSLKQKLLRTSLKKTLKKKATPFLFSSFSFPTKQSRVKEGQSLSTTKNFGNRIKKKFVSLFLNKITKRFLRQLKEQMMQCNKFLKQHRNEQLNLFGALRFAPLGYNQKWSLKRLNLLKYKPLFKLLKLIKIIEKKSLIKLETLRNDFIAFGAISKSEALSYYQIINFLKNLKIITLKVKKEQKRVLVKTLKVTNDKEKSVLSSEATLPRNINKKDLSLTLIKPNSPILTKAPFNNPASFALGERVSSVAGSITIPGSNKIINNEYRKAALIEYLKDIVKKHRTNNLFYYLSTISEARKNLKKIKQFTKLHSNFLFGSQVGSFTTALNKTESSNVVFNQIKNVIDLTSSGQKSNLQKELPEIFLEQLEKQRTMYKQLAELNPKISIKFYSVKKENVKIKASVISDSIIDALEKRKAFRKVIKDAKEDLMRNSKVKGVKIQVSGRLNGAEIARTEWVRSGRVPLQTLRANLDYSYKTAKTIYGILGIKVWVFKGYTKRA